MASQLQENQQRARIQQCGARYLLQGLIVCACCGYAYYGKPISPSARKGHERSYAYYRCIGSNAYRFGGLRLCWKKQLRTDLVDEAVWKEVCRLLEEPERLATEKAILQGFTWRLTYTRTRCSSPRATYS